MRKQILENLTSALSKISKKNGFNTDFNKISYWQDTPTEYSQNHLDIRDTDEEYRKENLRYNAHLCIEIIGIVVEDGFSAASLGTLALADLIRAIGELKTSGFVVDLKRSHKFVETKGKTAALIELEIVVKYKI